VDVEGDVVVLRVVVGVEGDIVLRVVVDIEGDDVVRAVVYVESAKREREQEITVIFHPSIHISPCVQYMTHFCHQVVGD